MKELHAILYIDSNDDVGRMYNPLKYVDPTGEQYTDWDPSLINRMEQEMNAGFIVGYRGFTFNEMRWAFDTYQGSSGEPDVSKYAQNYGFNIGHYYYNRNHGRY